MQTISQCTHCGELLGTRTTLLIHKPGKCRSEKTMQRAGAWRGYAGIWWTVDLGLDDESLGQPILGAETRINTGPELGQIGRVAYLPQNAVLSKFRSHRPMLSVGAAS